MSSDRDEPVGAVDDGRGRLAAHDPAEEAVRAHRRSGPGAVVTSGPRPRPSNRRGHAARIPASVTARPRTRTSSPTCAAHEPGRVVVAVAAPGPVDQDDVVGADLLAPATEAGLAREPPQPRAPLLLLLRRDGVGGGGRRPGPRRVGEDVHPRRARLLDHPQRALERARVLGREADDDVGRQVEVAGKRRAPQERGRVVPARHRAQDAVVAGLEGHVQVPRDGRRLAERRDQRLGQVVDLDRRQSQPSRGPGSHPPRGPAAAGRSPPRGRGSSRG